MHVVWKCNKSNCICYSITSQINNNAFDWEEYTKAQKE